MATDAVNERGTHITTVAFTDEDDAPVTPGSASYRIDDVGSDTEVRADTDIESLDEEIEIVWETADTSILDETHPYETRRMTVTWIYDTDKQNSAEYLLNIINLKGVTTPSPA